MVWPIVVVAALVSVVHTMPVSAQASRESRPPAAQASTELLNWISQAVTDYGVWSGEGRVRSTLAFDGCRAHLVQNRWWPRANRFDPFVAGRLRSDTARFDLKQVGEVTLFRHSAVGFDGVSLHTADGLRSFVVHTVSQGLPGSSPIVDEAKEGSLSIPLTSQHERIADALRRAAKVCGGGATRVP